MILNRLAVTKLLITFSMAGAPFFFAAFVSLAQQPGADTKAAPAKPRALPTDATARKGDFDDMMKRRYIWIVVPYSRTLYFNDKGTERGVVADNARDFERYINQKYKKQLGNRPITVYLVPTTRDVMLQKVADGLGDIAPVTLRLPRTVKKYWTSWRQRTRGRFQS
jgi:hypothetical protein